MIFTLKLLDIDNWPDVVELFGSDRECGLCFCMSHRVKAENEVLGEDAKKALHELVKEGKACSILAYDGDKCVGWCAVDPLKAQPGHDYTYWKHSEIDDVTWSIHCLFIHDNYRGKGLSGLMIDKAVSAAKERGAKKVIAYPIPKKMRDKFPEHSSEFSGRYNTYMKAGFKSTARINDFYEVVTLDL